MKIVNPVIFKIPILTVVPIFIPYSRKRWRCKTLANPQNKQLAENTLANGHNALNQANR